MVIIERMRRMKIYKISIACVVGNSSCGDDILMFNSKKQIAIGKCFNGFSKRFPIDGQRIAPLGSACEDKCVNRFQLTHIEHRERQSRILCLSDSSQFPAI